MEQAIEQGKAAEAPPQPRTQLEHELDVVLQITRALISLPADARERVTRYVTELTEGQP